MLINQLILIADISETNKFVLNPQLLTNPIILYTIHFGSILLVNVIQYAYIALKIYRVLCYSKLTFEWLPMVNPFIWPFSIFHLLTTDYFRFWNRILPPIKFEKSSFDISAIIALEALSSIIYFCVLSTSFLLGILEVTEKVMNS